MYLYLFTGLFGEGPAERRERLRQLLAKLGQDAIKKKKTEDETDKDKLNSTTWYHEGSESLRLARLWIASYSIPRANERLKNEKIERSLPESTRNSAKNELYKNLRKLAITATQVGDSRPISNCTFSPDTKLIATSSWSGACKLWSTSTLENIKTLRGHNAQAGSIVFHPFSTISQSDESVNLASCGSDGSVFLWNLKDDTPIKSLDGHEPHRVSKLEFHPSGRFLGTAVHDNSWRMWDLERQEEILFQEGHSKPVFDLSFQIDGSLCASGGMDAFGRIWDLRTGGCVMFMEGHLKGILSIDFSSNGYQVVTGSEDNTIKVWNIRQRAIEYTIPAHKNVISKVFFEKEHSRYIASCSYDGQVKFWAHPGWTPIHAVAGHDTKIMSMDITPDNNSLITSSYDRTFKLWSPDGLDL